MRPDLWLALKENVLVTDLQMIRPDLFIVLGYVSWWCFNNNLPCRVTSLIDDVPQRVTATHAEGRAADVSTRGFGPKDITNLISFLEEKVGDMGAFSKSDGKQRIAVYHDAGLGFHIHIQVKREINGDFYGKKSRH